MTTISNYQKALDRIKIIIDLEKETDPAGAFGFSIISAIRNKVNGQDIIDYIKSQAEDNKDLVVRVVGEELLNRINQL